ncbi:TPA: hypothetical protein IAA82_08740 [Candidatus Galligastranaerophilus gallistercoris]|nr:hypothetical protein [Candidatus Galligastranaerophilus gallistercoris]
MKRAQATLEYVLFTLIIVVFCVLISSLWNRHAIIQGGSFGVIDQNEGVHVPAMTE